MFTNLFLQLLILATLAASLSAFAAPDKLAIAPPAPRPRPSLEIPTQKIDINKATAQELATVKGFSASQIKGLLSYRKFKGDFKSFDDLRGIKGFKRITAKRLKDIEDQLVIGSS